VFHGSNLTQGSHDRHRRTAAAAACGSRQDRLSRMG
jgi:hypothetical protein